MNDRNRMELGRGGGTEKGKGEGRGGDLESQVQYPQWSVYSLRPGSAGLKMTCSSRTANRSLGGVWLTTLCLETVPPSLPS